MAICFGDVLSVMCSVFMEVVWGNHVTSVKMVLCDWKDGGVLGGVFREDSRAFAS